MTTSPGRQLVERRVDERAADRRPRRRRCERLEGSIGMRRKVALTRGDASADYASARADAYDAARHLVTRRSSAGSTTAARDPEAFWARAAAEAAVVPPWDRVFEWTFPTFRWFIGGETNLAYNALDHHVAHGPRRPHRADLPQRARRRADCSPTRSCSHEVDARRRGAARARASAKATASRSTCRRAPRRSC